MLKKTISAAILALITLQANSSEGFINLPKTVKPTDKVHIYPGLDGPPSKENYGFTSNITYIDLGDGILLNNAGATVRIARTIHSDIRIKTGKDVKWVVMENHHSDASQSLSYWRDVGAKIYSHEYEKREYAKSFKTAQNNLVNSVGQEAYTARNISKEILTYKKRWRVRMGEYNVYLLHYGPSLTRSTTTVYIPKLNVFLAGDMAFNGTIPKFDSHTDTKGWVNSLERVIQEIYDPVVIIPSRGEPMSIESTENVTYEYLREFQEQAIKSIDDDNPLNHFKENYDGTRFMDMISKKTSTHKHNLDYFYLENF